MSDPYAAFSKPVTSYDAISKPVSKAGKPKPKDGPVIDIVRSARSGLIKGAADLAEQAKRFSPAALAGDMLDTGVNMANDIGSLVDVVRGGPVKPAPRSMLGKNLGLSPNDSERAGKMIGGYHKPQTVAGRYADTMGQLAPAALFPGSAMSRVANVVLPAVGSETGALIAEKMGAGETGQNLARLGGGLFGGVATSVRLAPRAQRPVRDQVLERLTANQDPARMAAEAQRYNAAGIQPSLVDILDDSGRAVTRAAASRNTPARQAATDFGDRRALDLPNRMGTQARRVISQDPRTPDQIREAMATQRRTEANQAFGAVRGDTIPLGEDAVTALRSDYGRAAIVEAARRESNPEVRAALNRLSTDVLDNPGQTQITIGMADRISRVLNSQARAAGPDDDLARILGGFAEDVRGPARQASGGYANALEGYGANSRLMQAADVGENLLTRNTDEFVEQAGNLSVGERSLALAAARRAIERKAGESVGAAPGVARAIAEAPEQQARSAALLGQDRANQLQEAMRLEAMRVRNAQDVAPRTGSQTQLRSQDADNLASGVQTAQRVGGAITGNWRDAAGLVVDWVRSRGIDDQQAEQLVRMSMSDDPATAQRAIDYITQRTGPQGAQRLIELRSNAGLLGVVNGQAFQ